MFPKFFFLVLFLLSVVSFSVFAEKLPVSAGKDPNTLQDKTPPSDLDYDQSRQNKKNLEKDKKEQEEAALKKIGEERKAQQEN